MPRMVRTMTPWDLSIVLHAYTKEQLEHIGDCGPKHLMLKVVPAGNYLS